MAIRSVLLVVIPAVVGAACTVEADGRTFDFSQLSGKQVSSEDDLYRVDFTFCEDASNPCDSRASSMCQIDKRMPYQVSLGRWFNFSSWKAAENELTGTLVGDYCSDIQKPRSTTVTFVCSGSSTVFKSVIEPSPCIYEAVIYVPTGVCSSQCCTPPTYALKTLAGVGSQAYVVVVQKDASTGDFYDGTGPVTDTLCSKYYNRCFVFNDTFCTSSAYVPPPSPECYGGTLLGEFPVVAQQGIKQSVWAQQANYVITVPLGGGCVAVGGNGRTPTMDVSLSPDPALWEVPQVCFKALKSRF